MKNNDEKDWERELWVNNDEGLYDLYRASRLPMRAFIKHNKEIIDEVINAVGEGYKKPHYLISGT